MNVANTRCGWKCCEQVLRLANLVAGTVVVLSKLPMNEGHFSSQNLGASNFHKTTRLREIPSIPTPCHLTRWRVKNHSLVVPEGLILGSGWKVCRCSPLLPVSSSASNGHIFKLPASTKQILGRLYFSLPESTDSLVLLPRTSSWKHRSSVCSSNIVFFPHVSLIPINRQFTVSQKRSERLQADRCPSADSSPDREKRPWLGCRGVQSVSCWRTDSRPWLGVVGHWGLERSSSYSPWAKRWGGKTECGDIGDGKEAPGLDHGRGKGLPSLEIRKQCDCVRYKALGYAD